MKLSFTASVFLLAVASSALPYNGGKLETSPSWPTSVDPRTASIASGAIGRRQVSADQPSMSDGSGNVVPYSNPAGAGQRRAKRDTKVQRRQVSVDEPSMSDGSGNVVPYSNSAGANKRDVKMERRQVPVDQPSMSVGGVVVPYSNSGNKAKRSGKAY